MPEGATPLDFAFAIHSDIGMQASGARVNDKFVSLDTHLNNGDVVEVITQKGKKPSADWLRFIKTGLAKNQIRSALKEKQDRFRSKSETSGLEFKIVNQNRPGYLKDVTRVLGEMKINPLYLKSQTDARGALAALTIRTELLPKSRLEPLLVRLKKIPGTKEVGYKFNR